MRTSLLGAQKIGVSAVVGAVAVVGLTWQSATASADDEVVVSVGVADAQGDPAAHVPVTLYAWPSAKDLADVRVGQQVDRVEIARRATSRTGQVDILASDIADITNLMHGEKYLDIDVVGDLGSEGIVTRTVTLADSRVADGVPESAAVVDSRTGDVLRGSEVALNAPSTTATAGKRSYSATGQTVGESDEESKSQAEALTDVPSPTSTKASQDEVCPSTGTTLIENLGNRWVNVGNALIRVSGKESEFVYSTLASTSLGTAIEVDGIFTASDAVTREHTLKVEFPKITTPQYLNFDTQFSYGKYCTFYPTRGVSEVTVRPIKHEGGTRTRTGRSTLATPNCTPYAAGSSGTKNSTEAIRWNNGVKIEAVIGIDLSSQTGFTTAAEQKWSFTTAGNLCGSADFPGGDARVIAMQGLT